MSLQEKGAGLQTHTGMPVQTETGAGEARADSSEPPEEPTLQHPDTRLVASRHFRKYPAGGVSLLQPQGTKPDRLFQEVGKQGPKSGRAAAVATSYARSGIKPRCSDP